MTADVSHQTVPAERGRTRDEAERLRHARLGGCVIGVTVLLLIAAYALNWSTTGGSRAIVETRLRALQQENDQLQAALDAARAADLDPAATAGVGPSYAFELQAEAIESAAPGRAERLWLTARRPMSVWLYWPDEDRNDGLPGAESSAVRTLQPGERLAVWPYAPGHAQVIAQRADGAWVVDSIASPRRRNGVTGEAAPPAATFAAPDKAAEPLLVVAGARQPMRIRPGPPWPDSGAPELVVGRPGFLAEGRGAAANASLGGWLASLPLLRPLGSE